MKIKYAILMAVTLFSLKVRSQDCKVANPNAEDLSEYYTAIVDSLINLKSIKSENDSKEDVNPTQAMVQIKITKGSFQCSYEIIKSYSISKVKEIAVNSKDMATGYLNLSQQLSSILKELKNVLDGKNKISPGESADRESDRILQMQKNWELISKAVASSLDIRTLISDPKTKKEIKRYISKEQRDQLVTKLKENFALPVKENESNAVVVIANYINETLLQVEYE